jgi:hypothetical protein
MVALTENVLVNGRAFAKGTDHTLIPAWALQKMRNPERWAGGVLPPPLQGPPPEPALQLNGMTATQARAALGVTAGESGIDTTGAADGYIAVYSAAQGKFVPQPNEGGPAVIILLRAPLANGAVFTSGWYDRDAPFPGRSFVTARLQVTSDVAFTAKLQTSSDMVTATDALTYTVAGNATDQEHTPAARYVMWVITATAAGMTTMDAKAVLS